MALLWLAASALLLVTANAEETKQAAPPLNGTVADKLPGNNVVCTPTNWYDIVWFYFANYVMHALSVRSLPGENLFTSITFKFACLLIPFTGIRRGLCLIARASNLTRNDLQAAARANALCMVIRGEEWRPLNEQEVSGCKIERVERNSTEDGNVSEATLTHVGATEKESEIRVEKLGEKKAQEVQEPTAIVKPTPTMSTTASAEEGSGSVAFRLSDCYDPPKDNNFLDKLYRWFVQTYKFGRSSLSKSIRLDPEYVKVHGLCNLAPGYELAYVPSDIKVHTRGIPVERPPIMDSLGVINFHTLAKAITSQTRLASSQNAPRILFSLGQTVSGAWSLYRAQGEQIERFGYAAYGLTVLPYMIVSVINFAGSFLTKEYDMIYLVHSTMLDEMISRGGSVDGVIGTIEPKEEDLAEPTSPNTVCQSRSRVAVQQEILQPEGSTLQFRLDPNDNVTNSSDPNTTDSPSPSLTYRDSSVSSTWSNALTLTSLPSLKDPGSIRSYFQLDQNCRAWWRRKFKKDPIPQPPAGLTIIHIPCHGTLLRLPPPSYEGFLRVFTLALLIASWAVPFIVITLLTGWKVKESESSYRSAVLNWLVCGMLLGYGAGSVENLSGNSAILKGFAIVFASYGSYCIYGFVTVAQEMLKIGKCTAF